MTLLDSVLPFSAGLLSVPVVTASLFCPCPFPWARCAAFSIASAIQYCWYFGGRPLLVFPWIWNIFEAQGPACMDRQSLMAARKSTIYSPQAFSLQNYELCLIISPKTRQLKLWQTSPQFVALGQHCTQLSWTERMPEHLWHVDPAQE